MGKQSAERDVLFIGRQVLRLLGIYSSSRAGCYGSSVYVEINELEDHFIPWPWWNVENVNLLWNFDGTVSLCVVVFPPLIQAYQRSPLPHIR